MPVRMLLRFILFYTHTHTNIPNINDNGRNVYTFYIKFFAHLRRGIGYRVKKGNIHASMHPTWIQYSGNGIKYIDVRKMHLSV